jgi:hypothetical protein
LAKQQGDIILNKNDQTVHNETTLDSINTDFKKTINRDGIHIQSLVEFISAADSNC